MHQWQSLNLTSWTLLVSQEVRQCKIYYCTRVKLRFLRVYIESLTMFSQEPPKKKSKQVENKQGTLLLWVKPWNVVVWHVPRSMALTEGPKRGGGSLCWPLAQPPPPQAFYACYGPVKGVDLSPPQRLPLGIPIKKTRARNAVRDGNYSNRNFQDGFDGFKNLRLNTGSVA